MKYTMRLAIGWALILAMSGCGSSDPEGLLKEKIKILNELAEAMETKAPQATIDAINKRGEQLANQMKGLTLSDSEKKRLGEKYGVAEMEATMRVLKTQAMNMPAELKGLFGKGLDNLPDFKNLQKGLENFPDFKDLKLPDGKNFPQLPDPPK